MEATRMTSSREIKHSEMEVEVDDGVVANETLVVDVPLGVGDGKWAADGPGADGGEKDNGPPDGGYGWVVVGYAPPGNGNSSAIFVLNAFTWGINSV
jgi:hypothetical protein